MSPRAFPSWDDLYRSSPVEALPWYWPQLDRDFEAALERHRICSGQVLDQGTGPGTQAIALAERGFAVTATDISAAAIAHAAQSAKLRGVQITFVRDDVLETKLDGPFDAIFDRGCFHVLAPADRTRYALTMRRLLAPSGWLFLKTFSHRQPGTQGPYRLAPEQIRKLFDARRRFEVTEILDTDFQGQLGSNPKALFCAIKAR